MMAPESAVWVHRHALTLQSYPVDYRKTFLISAKSMQAALRHRLAGIMRPPRPLSSNEAISDDAKSCSAARCIEASRLVRRGAVAANHDVENGARGARLERHRRHQTSVVRAFWAQGGGPFAGFLWGVRSQRVLLR